MRHLVFHRKMLMDWISTFFSSFDQDHDHLDAPLKIIPSLWEGPPQSCPNVGRSFSQDQGLILKLVTSLWVWLGRCWAVHVTSQRMLGCMGGDGALADVQWTVVTKCISLPPNPHNKDCQEAWIWPLRWWHLKMEEDFPKKDLQGRFHSPWLDCVTCCWLWH